jgi:serine/threonine protein phosphatase 1
VKVVLGDIHGCFDEFIELLDLVGPGEDDCIIAIGDLPDYGPDAPKVVTFFARRRNALSLRGNHERKHVRVVRGLMSQRNFGRAQRATVEQFDRALRSEGGTLSYREAIELFASFPLSIEFPEALLVHAGFEYGVPLGEQDERVLTGSGFMPQNRHAADGLFAWCETYPRDAKPIIFGHLGVGRAPWPYPQRENLWPIDTGCASGGYLTAVTLPDFKVFQVRARKEYRKRRSRGLPRP